MFNIYGNIGSVSILCWVLFHGNADFLIS